MTSETHHQHHRARPDSDVVDVLSRARRFLAADSVGMAEVSEAIGEQLLSRPLPLVLVLGETGRGKTSLVRLLAPHVTSPADEDALAERFRRVAPPDGSAELAGPAWIGVEGARLPSPTGAAGAEVAWESCLLGEDTVLLEAPSPEGIDGPQAVLNKSLAAGATTAVFVTDAGAPISKPEADYLAEVMSRLDSLTVVVTKTDLFPNSWEEVVATDSQILSGIGERPVEVIGLSVPLAEFALGQADPARKADLLARSGLEAVRARLVRELGRGARVPYSSGLLMTRSALLRHRRALEDRCALAAGGTREELADAVAARRDRLAELHGVDESWREYFNRDVQTLRADLVEVASARVEDWEARWTRRLEEEPKLSKRPEDRAVAVKQLLTELAELRQGVLEEAELRLGEFLVGLFASISTSELDDGDSPADIPGSQTAPGGAPAKALREGTRTPFELTTAIQGLFGASLITRIGVPALGALGVPVGLSFGSLIGIGLPVIAGGLAYMGLLRKMRQSTEDRRALVAEVRRAARDERASIVAAYDGMWNRMRPDVVLAFQRRLKEALKSADGAVKDAVTQQNRSAADSATLKAALTEDLRVTNHHLERVEKALTALRTARA